MDVSDEDCLIYIYIYIHKQKYAGYVRQHEEECYAEVKAEAAADSGEEILFDVQDLMEATGSESNVELARFCERLDLSKIIKDSLSEWSFANLKCC